MKLTFSHARLACSHASSLKMKLALARWRGRADLMPQGAWQLDVQGDLIKWLEAGGFSGTAPAAPETKTAAKGRRSLASQRDSNEEFQFSLIRIQDAAK